MSRLFLELVNKCFDKIPKNTVKGGEFLFSRTWGTLHLLNTLSLSLNKTRNVRVNIHTNEVRSRSRRCGGETISIQYYRCMSEALVIRHAVRMRRIMLSSMATLTVPYFSTLSHVTA